MRPVRGFRRLSLALFFVLLFPAPALAAKPITVGNGTAASCTETALKDALLVAETIGGGRIRFNCGPEPLTISFTQATQIPGTFAPVLLIIPNNSTIDGAGLVSLAGAAPGPLFEATCVFVESGTTAALKGLTIDGCDGGPVAPGGILNRGTLTIRESTVSGNRNMGGGAGIQNTGTLTIVDSVVADNISRGSGSGISNAGTLEIRRTIIVGNGNSDGSGGGIYNVGALTIADSEVSGNFADRSGGGISNDGVLTVRRSIFSGNGAIFGGAVHNSGTFTVQRSTFSGNGATFGGGIFNRNEIVVERSFIIDNTASLNGGGIFNCAEQGSEGDPCRIPATLSLKHTTVTGNTPDDIFP